MGVGVADDVVGVGFVVLVGFGVDDDVVGLGLGVDDEVVGRTDLGAPSELDGDAVRSAIGPLVESGVDAVGHRVVHGGERLVGAEVTSHGDHRIAMAMAIAALAADDASTIDGWDAVATSYPTFEADLMDLQGNTARGRH